MRLPRAGSRDPYALRSYSDNNLPFSKGLLVRDGLKTKTSTLQERGRHHFQRGANLTMEHEVQRFGVLRVPRSIHPKHSPAT